MEFEWDENKRRRILEERGVDILYAALIFEGEVLSWVDDRRDYGEERRISLGLRRGRALRRRPYRAKRDHAPDHGMERRPG